MRQFETARSRALAILHRHGGMTAKELADMTAIDQSNARRVLAQLVRDGLVQEVGVRRDENGGRPAAVYVNRLAPRTAQPLLHGA